MSLGKEVTKKVISAYIPESEYTIYAGFTKKQNERFAESIKNFKAPNNQVNHCVDFGRRGLKTQEEYTDIPFRMEEYDSEGTVASAGSAIIITKFLEQIFKCNVNASIVELAELAVEKGYRGYKSQPNGTYQSKGVKHVFWEKFIPSLYGLESKRVLSIRDMMNGLWDNKLSVILLSEKACETEGEAEKFESGFVLLTGYSPEGITFFDPRKCDASFMEYADVLPLMRAAWMIWEESDY